MRKTISITALLMVICLSGCSMQKDYMVKLDEKNRKAITSINLTVEHNKEPSYHGFLYMGEQRSGEAMRAWPVGASADWSYEKHKADAASNMILVGRAVESSFTDDSFVHRIFSDLAAGSDRIALLGSADTQAPVEVNNPYTRLDLYIYYKVGVSVKSPFEPFTYLGVVAKLINPDDTVIYHRRVFSESRNITPEFLQNEFKDFVESSVKTAAKTFWADISR